MIPGHVLDGKLADESQTSPRPGTIPGRALDDLFTSGRRASPRADVVLGRVLCGIIAREAGRPARVMVVVFVL